MTTDDIYHQINAPRLALVDKLAQGLKDNTPLTLTLNEIKLVHDELSEMVMIPFLDFDELANGSK